MNKEFCAWLLAFLCISLSGSAMGRETINVVNVSPFSTNTIIVKFIWEDTDGTSNKATSVGIENLRCSWIWGVNIGFIDGIQATSLDGEEKWYNMAPVGSEQFGVPSYDSSTPCATRLDGENTLMYRDWSSMYKGKVISMMFRTQTAVDIDWSKPITRFAVNYRMEGCGGGGRCDLWGNYAANWDGKLRPLPANCELLLDSDTINHGIQSVSSALGSTARINGRLYCSSGSARGKLSLASGANNSNLVNDMYKTIKHVGKLINSSGIEQEVITLDSSAGKSNSFTVIDQITSRPNSTGEYKGSMILVLTID
ncbi:MAG: hypothetical protein ACQEWL_21655 [Pseudomonadota bacterium]